MNSVVTFIEVESRVISATYRNLMVRAKVVLIDKVTGEPLPEQVTTIASPVPSGVLRIRLPDSVKPGIYFLRALNTRGDRVAQSVEFRVD
jgi:hypothetical protein